MCVLCTNIDLFAKLFVSMSEPLQQCHADSVADLDVL